MHGVNPSRGKILFEVFCALAISASLAGAWLQTGASALLGAVAVSALYGLVHLFDMRRPKPVEAVEPQRIDFEPEHSEIVVPMVAVEDQPTVVPVGEECELAEPAPSRSGSGRRAGGSRKGSERRAKTEKKAKAAELETAEPVAAPWPMAEEVAEPEVAPPADEEFAFIPDEDESSHSHIAPLFEPEPFARMPRRAFGRRGRL